MTASCMEALVANIFPNATSVQTLDNVTRCTAQSSVPSSHLSSHNFISGVFFGSDSDHNDHYYHDPYSDMPLCHLWIKPVSLGKYRQVIRKSGWQSSCLWSRPGERFAWPACSPGLNPIGQL